MKLKNLILGILIFGFLTSNIFAVDLSVDNLRKFNKIDNTFVFEGLVSSDVNLSNFNFIFDFGDGSNYSSNALIFNELYIYTNHSFANGPHNISLIIDNNNSIIETDETNNNLSINFCISGTEIPNDGIDQDCDGSDLIDILNITINAPVLDAPGIGCDREWNGTDWITLSCFRTSTPRSWDIDISLNKAVNSCWYEFGIREGMYQSPPVYYAVTDAGVLTKDSDTSYSSLGVTPTEDHNYLMVFCNTTLGNVFNESVHVEIDTKGPSPVTDLNVSYHYVYGWRTLSFTIPGEDYDANHSWIYGLDIRNSTSSINESNWDNATHITDTNCYYSYVGGTKVTCVVSGFDEFAVLINGTIVRKTDYFAIKFWDNLGNVVFSNSDSSTTKYYDCGFDYSLKKISPIAYNGSNYHSFYEGDIANFTMTITNYGDKHHDISENGCFLNSEDIFAKASTMQNFYEKFDNRFIPLDTNESITYNLIINDFNTSDIQGYGNKFKASAMNMSEYTGYDADSSNNEKQTMFYSWNFTKYLTAERIYETRINYASGNTVEFVLRNLFSKNLNPQIVRNSDSFAVALKWIPVNFTYEQIGGDILCYAITDINAPHVVPGTLTHSGGLNYVRPQEFIDYTCSGYSCLFPDVEESSGALLAWELTSLTPNCVLDIGVIVGNEEIGIVESTKTTVFS